ncbi:hypothetical protein GOBAR_DD12646 [Gossypium barbadense]|nr:hypothetical protein GOBAR_DD12646 [Gossypium barbadense]
MEAAPMMDSCQEDEDFDLSKADVKCSLVNGIPSIDFSERVNQILNKGMAFTVVIKLLGQNIGYSALYNNVCSLWKSTQPFRLMDVENGYFLEKFQSSGDFQKVLCQGGMVRQVAKLDFNTENGVRGRFARMAVYVNLEKAMTFQVFINGSLQRIEYEYFPTVYFSCGHYGHVKEICTKETTKRIGSGLEFLGEEREYTATRNSNPKGSMSNGYGPWVLVERRGRRSPRTTKAKDGEGIGIAYASRF